MSDWYVLAEDGKTPVQVPNILTDPNGYKDAMHDRHDRYDWIVGKTKVGEYEVSTVFLFLDHKMTGAAGKPVLWESLVFGDGPWSDYGDRYTSREDAERGHQAIIDKITASAETEAKIRALRREADELAEQMLSEYS